VAFRPAKLVKSIAEACKDIHLPAKRAKTVVGKVSRAVLRAVAKRKTVTVAVLREKVLANLDKIEPAVAKAFRKYEARRRARRARR
jgi:molybdenum-dependent DNA-binding transcriptional regulator ModE